MKLKLLKSVAYSFADSILSSESYIQKELLTSVIYREAFDKKLKEVQFDVLSHTFEPIINIYRDYKFFEISDKVLDSLLEKHGLKRDVVQSFVLKVEVKGERRDVVDLECLAFITDFRGKEFASTKIKRKYPESVY